MKQLHFVVVVPPGPESQFVEVEDEHGKSFNAGEWRKRDDGLWELIVKLPTAFRERVDVLAFQQKFEVPMASQPTFLDDAAFNFRFKFLEEELTEFRDSHLAGDMHGAADALVDLDYVLHGTALMMGLPWPRLWDEVQRANMTKERATHAGQSKRKSALDVIKPPGWTAPDHTAALGVGPWPTLKTEVRDESQAELGI